MSKTFQEIEISNGSWIKEQSDPINILNENNFIDLSEDTFRLFDAMIFISYNASPLMHALEILKQSLEYKNYWEKSLDYIISDINLQEYNNKSKVGIETFVLFWKIISNKNSYSDELKKQLINEIINTSYDLEMDLNIDFLNDPNNNWIGKPFNTKRFCFSQNKYRLKTIINNKININIVKNTNNIIKDVKYKKYENLINSIWNNAELSDLILVANITKFDISTVIKWFIAKIYIFLKFKKDWSKRELRNWLKANLVIFKLWNNADLTVLISISNIIKPDISFVTIWFINIIYEDFEQDQKSKKFGNSNKNSNKFESTFNKVLLDINKNIYEYNSKNYISKNNFIIKDFIF
jgi:hypothetical protein